MPFVFQNLTDRVRHFMLEEMDADSAAGNLFFSSRLSARGREQYKGLLRDALGEGDDGTFAAELQALGRLNATENQRRGDKIISKRVPSDAAQTLAEGEFNRFYIRGLCRLAIEQGVETVEVYRAKAVRVPRADSVALIGTRVAARDLLDDLRINIGVDTALGLPNGPNSGLSARLSPTGSASDLTTDRLSIG